MTTTTFDRNRNKCGATSFTLMTVSNILYFWKCDYCGTEYEMRSGIELTPQIWQTIPLTGETRPAYLVTPTGIKR